MKLSRSIALAIGVAVLIPALAYAATDTQTLTINAVVGARAKIVMSPTTINFPDADPDVVPSIPATENAVSIECRIRAAGAGISNLTCLANGDLVAAGATDIPISNVTWTATGTGYLAGTMDNSTAQAVGSFSGSGPHAGTMSFFLANSWAYEVGNYTQTVDYTLTTP